MRAKVSAILRLSDGQALIGKAIGAPLSSSGELVFTTGMVGYSETLTDPSYFGQVIVFAYPLIGNYGVPELRLDPQGLVPRGFESPKIHAAGVVVSSASATPSHWNSSQSLSQWLEREGVPGIEGIDTRHLVHSIRESKTLFARIETSDARGQREPFSGESFFDPSKHNLMPWVSTRERRVFGRGRTRIGLIDCGAKWNLIRPLIAGGCEVTLVPWDADFAQVDCDAWLISNGPGDPMQTGDLRARISQELKRDRPILGVCLGHQLLALAAGAQTERMPYGHRSHNQPVEECGTRRGFLTAQNHGYTVIPRTLPEGWEPWFLNANDRTIEGIRHKSRPFRSVQFHPEACGGPRDTAWILDQFVAEVSR